MGTTEVLFSGGRVTFGDFGHFLRSSCRRFGRIARGRVTCGDFGHFLSHATAGNLIGEVWIRPGMRH